MEPYTKEGIERQEAEKKEESSKEKMGEEANGAKKGKHPDEYYEY